jgi:methylglutamate dehydrogenase subunit B
MRISCPFCGERDLSEFAYYGDAAPRDATYEAVYLRENPAGPHDELWYHAFGCRGWLRVRRDTRTHEILGAELAGEQCRP